MSKHITSGFFRLGLDGKTTVEAYDRNLEELLFNPVFSEPQRIPVPKEVKEAIEASFFEPVEGCYVYNEEQVLFKEVRRIPFQGNLASIVNEIEKGNFSSIHTISGEDLKEQGVFDTDSHNPLIQAEGVSSGSAKGMVVFSTEDAINARRQNKPIILIKERPVPEDIPVIKELSGLIITEGDVTAHPVILARNYGIPCVTGLENYTLSASALSIGETTISEGEIITLDGSTGNVFGDIPLAESSRLEERLCALLANESRVGTYINLDSTLQLEKAYRLSADGVGLLRSEYLIHDEEKALTNLQDFMNGDSQDLTQFRDNFSKLLSEVYDVFTDVRVRLLDYDQDELNMVKKPIHRGSRQSLLEPNVYIAQLEAISDASVRKQRIARVFIPFISDPSEARFYANMAREVLPEGSQVGFMIETPAAMLQSSEIAEYADFVTFGTNDLYALLTGAERKSCTDLRQSMSANDIDFLPISKFLDWICHSAYRIKSDSPEVKIGVCGELPYSKDILRELSPIDYISTSADSLPKVRLYATQLTRNQN